MRSTSLTATAVLAAMLTLTACSDSGSGQGGLNSAATVPGPEVGHGTAVTDADLVLDDLAAGIPDGWTVSTFQGLTYAVPPASEGGVAFADPEPDGDGYLSLDWSGDLIPETATPDATGAAHGMAQRLLIRANSSVDWDEQVHGEGTVFRASLPGIDGPVGGLLVQTPAPVFDDAGNVLADQTVSDIWIYIQADSGTYYEVHLTTSPGDPGLAVLRQFLGTLSLA